MTSREDHDDRFPGLYMGTVVDNDDKERMGRVRVRIEGFVERSRWAYPLGTVGGGAKRRGFFSVPAVGSEVGVLFAQGDVDHPHYLAGHWGNAVDGAADDGASPGSELPQRVRDLPSAEQRLVSVFETERWAILLDDRQEAQNTAGEPQPDDGSGRNSLLIMSKDDPNTSIELDGARRGVTIKSTVAIFLEATGMVSIDGALVQIAGRRVVPSKKPIT